MAVAANAIGGNAAIELGEEHFLFGAATRTGNARHGSNHDVIRCNHFFFDEGNERQQRTGGVAAGVGDEARLRDGLARELGEAIDGLLLELLGLVLAAVPFLFFLFFPPLKVEF